MDPSQAKKSRSPRRERLLRLMLPRSLRAELVADEGDDGDVIAEFLADLLEQGVHGVLGLLGDVAVI